MNNLLLEDFNKYSTNNLYYVKDVCKQCKKLFTENKNISATNLD